MARRDPFLFHALVWAELKSESGEGQIEDWVARMIPPDPDGVRRGDLKENYRREYGSLMFDKTRYGRKNRRELEDWYSDVGDTDDDDD
jgi:hypothetical protein